MKRAATEELKCDTKSFIVNHLSGIRDRFEMDITTSTLGDFRKKVSSTGATYSIMHQRKMFLYTNDADETLLATHMEKYMPSLINQEASISLHLILNLGGPLGNSGNKPTTRIGKLLLSDEKAEKLENAADTPSILMCPITISLVTRAFKLNDRFYELESAATYLFDIISRMDDELEDVLCPLRCKVPQELVSAITWYLFKRGNSASSLIYCLVLVSRVEGHQEEYDELLLSSTQ